MLWSPLLPPSGHATFPECKISENFYSALDISENLQAPESIDLLLVPSPSLSNSPNEAQCPSLSPYFKLGVKLGVSIDQKKNSMYYTRPN
jgi:hypothetical protein